MPQGSPGYFCREPVLHEELRPLLKYLVLSTRILSCGHPLDGLDVEGSEIVLRHHIYFSCSLEENIPPQRLRTSRTSVNGICLAAN